MSKKAEKLPNSSNTQINDIIKAANGAAGPSVLQVISERFVAATELNRVEAWRQLQKDIMLAAPVICPAIIPYKDLLGAVADIEGKVKGSTGMAGKSNEEIMADFLSGSGSLVITQMDIGPDLERDKISDIIEIDGGANGPATDIPLSERPAPTPLSPPSDSPSS